MNGTHGMVHKRGGYFRIRGWGIRLIVGSHRPLFTERYGYMKAVHTRWFCLALLTPARTR